jgi:Uma2 family endonuclease
MIYGMAAAAAHSPTGGRREEDQRVILHDVTWSQYEAILAIRGDGGGVRLTYLNGELELMSPSLDHEAIKTTMARLLEAYAEERGLTLNGYGSWTVRSAPRARSAEPDECYVLGEHRPSRPDIAIEVIWTSGGLDKLDVYRGLGVREVWIWREGRIEVHALRGERYQPMARSEVLPDLDLDEMASFVGGPDQTAAVRAFRGRLRGDQPPPRG